MSWMKVGLATCSVFLCVFIAEFALHFIVEPVDFLNPTLIDDPITGHRIAPGSGGHDRWGFRNRNVPEQVDIVAIGDSQTYGVSALAFESWPAWLETLSGQTVYNMALGGWGPIQYEYLLDERALSLKPATVVVGLYFGNDFFDAHRVVYGLDHWQALRAEDRDDLLSPYSSVERDRGEGAIMRLRIWLARRSILYRLVANTFGQFAGRLELQLGKADPRIIHLQDPDLEIGLTPAPRLDVLDRSRPEIQAGYELTKDALTRVVARCRAEGVQLIVLLIPTKETVFEQRLSGREELPQAATIAQLLLAEREARNELIAFLTAQGVTVVDPLPALRQAGRHTPIYPSNEGGHPVSAGYRAIAESVLVELDPPPAQPSR